MAPDASPPGRIRIGLTQDRTRVHLTAKNGPVKIWLGEAVTGTLIGTIPAGLTWKVGAKDTGYLVKDETGTSVGGKTWGGPSVDLILSYEEDGGRVFIPETDEIWGDGFSYSRGTIEFNLYGCKSGGCEERLIARLGFEEYLYGIGEVPASWPMAALRTQAVAARTYATYSLRHYGLRGSCNCNLTDGSGDQVYAGYVRESGTLGARWMNAVDTTAHEIVTYDGKVIQAFYSSSDGGHTENVEDVWHGGDPAFAIPWLRGVCDPGEWASGNSWLDWTRTFDANTLTARLVPYTGNIGTITTFRSIVRGRSGRIVSLKARGTGGSASLSGGELRAGLGLPDDRVWINADRNILGSIRVMYDEADVCARGSRRVRPCACKAAPSSSSRQGGSIATRTSISPSGSEERSTPSSGRSEPHGAAGTARVHGAGAVVEGVVVHAVQAGRLRGRADLLEARHRCARALGARPRSLSEGRRPGWRARLPHEPGQADRHGWYEGQVRTRVDRVQRERLVQGPPGLSPDPERGASISSRRRACPRARSTCTRGNPRSPVRASSPGRP